MEKNIFISICRFLTQLLFLSLFVIGFISFKTLMLPIIIISVFLGPFFCGWMCFLGFYQDICRYIGKFIKKEPFEPSEKAHNILKYLRYVILIGAITVGGFFLFPQKVWGNFAMILKGNISLNFIFYFLIFLGVLSLFTKRFFCRYLCPIGAKLGLFSLLRPITINKDASCISCRLCSKKCPMKIPIHKVNSLASPNCISCLKCIEVCPEKSLKIGIRNYLKP
ncbi:MAG: 4Fe-4S binding protein [Candidatus Gastranaerophilales bacterium]|nr:4Fe-4S binding protein [Candidatus Gastranaerophilales bacterium]